jgi:hypothetical protein
MIIFILCGLFLCVLNLTLFSLCQKKIAYVFTQFGRTIKAVQCDNGREFDNASSHTFFATNEVFLWMSCSYTSSQNGKADRFLRTINNMLRSLLFQASILTRYWVEGLRTVTYLLNRLPTKAISTTSPYFTLHGVASSYEHLCVFGCACYPNLSAKAAHKLTPQSTRCIFLGYNADHKGYQCFDLTTNIVISQHVVFDETDFPFSVSPHLTNDLEIFMPDDSPGAAPMPAPLSVPRVPPGFPLLALAGGPIALLGGSTVPVTEAGGQTESPGSQTAPGIESGGSTATPGSQTARPCAASSSPALLTSVARRAVPTTSTTPHVALSTPSA